MIRGVHMGSHMDRHTELSIGASMDFVEMNRFEGDFGEKRDYGKPGVSEGSSEVDNRGHLLFFSLLIEISFPVPQRLLQGL